MAAPAPTGHVQLIDMARTLGGCLESYHVTISTPPQLRIFVVWHEQYPCNEEVHLDGWCMEERHLNPPRVGGDRLDEIIYSQLTREA